MRANTGPESMSAEATTFDPFWSLSLDLLCVAGFDGYFKRLSRSWEAALGYSLAELTAVPYLEFVHPDDRERTTEAARGLPDNQAVRSFSNRYRCRDGSYRWLRWNATPRLETQEVYAVAHDETDARFATAVQGRLAAAVEQSTDAVFMTDPHGRITYCNRAFEQLTGYAAAQALGRMPSLLSSRVHAPEFYRDLWATLLAGQVWASRIRNRRQDGTLYDAHSIITPVRDETGAVTAFVSSQHDLTGELELQGELAEARTLRTLGKLLVGVTHDYKNLLACLHGFAEGLHAKGLADPEIGEYLTELRRLVQQGEELVAQLLGSSRPEPRAPTALDLNGFVEATARLLRRTLPPTVRVEARLGDGVGNALADESALRRVLVELAVNALTAMPEGGTIRLTTFRDRREVGLEVADTGSGMPAETLARAFDPGFTTSGEAGGWGLGLSAARDALVAMGGSLAAASAAGQGSAFTVRLPAA